MCFGNRDTALVSFLSLLADLPNRHGYAKDWGVVVWCIRGLHITISKIVLVGGMYHVHWIGRRGSFRGLHAHG
jgi:hypothetical protein